jgi:predicted RNA binding protein YcfA (HicA-like mRNA interferase family)
MKTRDLLKIIEADGWVWVRTRGSPRIFEHKTKPNQLSVPVHNYGKDVPIGTEKSILKQAGLR